MLKRICFLREARVALLLFFFFFCPCGQKQREREIVQFKKFKHFEIDGDKKECGLAQDFSVVNS